MFVFRNLCHLRVMHNKNANQSIFECLEFYLLKQALFVVRILVIQIINKQIQHFQIELFLTDFLIIQ